MVIKVSRISRKQKFSKFRVFQKIITFQKSEFFQIKTDSKLGKLIFQIIASTVK